MSTSSTEADMLFEDSTDRRWLLITPLGGQSFPAIEVETTDAYITYKLPFTGECVTVPWTQMGFVSYMSHDDRERTLTLHEKRKAAKKREAEHEARVKAAYNPPPPLVTEGSGKWVKAFTAAPEDRDKALREAIEKTKRNGHGGPEVPTFVPRGTR